MLLHNKNGVFKELRRNKPPDTVLKAAIFRMNKSGYICLLPISRNISAMRLCFESKF